MGIQDYRFETDFMNNLVSPMIFVAKRNKDVIGSTVAYEDLNLTFNLNAFDEISFKLYEYVDGKRQEYYDAFEEDNYVMVVGVSWYKIHVSIKSDVNGTYKEITGSSIECTLGLKRLLNFEVNAGEIDYESVLEPTKFYQPGKPAYSLLDRVLNITPSWTVGYVQPSLMHKQRTFDVSDTDVYSFLTDEVSKAFNCLFVFDTFAKTVNAYDLDNYGKETNIYISQDNLAQSIDVDINENSIITMYRVTGGDGVYVEEVNPNGTNHIYNFEYYLPQMDSDLRSAVQKYTDAYNGANKEYEDLILQIDNEISTISELKNRLPQTSMESTDWTEYGSVMLQSRVDGFDAMNITYKSQGFNKKDHISYDLYLENANKLKAARAELKKRKSEIEEHESTLSSAKKALKTLQNSLSMRSFFTTEQWKALDSYIIEENYSNDNYIVTDLEDDEERLDIERQLFEAASKDLAKKCRPQFQYSTSLDNLLTIPEFKDILPDFQLGNKITLGTNYNTNVRLRIISFTVDYNDTTKIDVTFSDSVNLHGVFEDAASIQAQVSKATTSFEFNKDSYDKFAKANNWISNVINNGLNVAATNIFNANNQEQTWDEHGMRFRKWNDQKQAYENEQMAIINNLLVFTDDAFESAKMAIGKIEIGNGVYAYGINAEVLFGKMILGEGLSIVNDSGNFTIGNSGMVFTNGTNTIKMNPSDKKDMFTVYKGSNKLLYLDDNGNLQISGNLNAVGGTFSGTLSSANGTFSGTLSSANGTFNGTVSAGKFSGGEININDNFIVDTYGNLTAKTGKFGGELDAATGTFQGKVTAAEIDINGKFKVNKQGKVTATDGVFTGGGKFTDSFSVQVTGETYGTGSTDLYEIKCADSATLMRYTRSGGMNSASGEVKITTDSEQNSIVVLRADSIKFVEPGSTHYLSDFMLKTDTPSVSLNSSNTTIFYTTEGTISVSNASKAGSVSKASNIATVNWVNSKIPTKTSQLTNDSKFLTSHQSLAGYLNTVSRDSSDDAIGVSKCVHNLYNSGNAVKWQMASIGSSDERLKVSISDLPDFTDIYMKLEPKRYRFNDELRGYNKQWQFGLLAGRTRDIFQENGYSLEKNALVWECDTDEYFGEDKFCTDGKVLKMDKDQLHALHIQMIQKLQREIDELNKAIDDLRDKKSKS